MTVARHRPERPAARKALAALGGPLEPRYYLAGIHALQTLVWQRSAEHCGCDAPVFIDRHRLHLRHLR